MQIIFLDSGTLDHGDVDMTPLIQLGDYHAYGQSTAAEGFERVSEAEVLIVNKHKVDGALLNHAPKLKAIMVAATGYNNLDLAAIKQRDIIVCNAKSYSTQGVAQHVLALILNHYHHTQYYHDQVDGGRWSSIKDFCFYDHSIEDLCGKTLGIIGFGTIGKKLSKIAHGFEMEVVAYTSYPISSEYDYTASVDLYTLLTKSDIISLHCPLNEDTMHVINKDTLALMKKNALLINTGRGPLIHEEDLKNHLVSNQKFFALLDVLSIEPPEKEHTLTNLQNCKFTPHIAWASRQSRQKLIDQLVKNIEGIKSGFYINRIT